ncbi:solute carrier family 13 member 1 isoform X18 [Syngnathoides biaculeatus]|uniref:solute carrier family 13 member 1 isoform X18 n=1 Tax=Syngnathoides biaculeatus TaxID=300417 RepID=UPI002ADE062B|nr:solute carrier family 13 member 1 isoform X18 [Syngnathoides biaculeatus]
MWRKLRSAAWNYRRALFIAVTPPLLLPLPLVVATKEASCAFVLLLMAAFWTTEVIPLAVTATLPAVLFPAFGIMTSSQVATAYFKDFHFLLVGVSCLAASIRKWGLHRRAALLLVGAAGVRPARLTLGFMSGCGFLSMWVHNTSAVAMVMPVAEAVLRQVRRADEGAEGAEGRPRRAPRPDEMRVEEENQTLSDDHKLPEERSPSSSPSSSSAAAAAAAASNSTQAACATAPPTDLTLGKAMCIGVAYASNIGGIATLPGTSPNLIFFEYLRQIYPECNGVNFGKWLALCLPISVLTLLLTWAWLCWLFIRSDVRSLRRCGGELSEREKAGRKVIRDQYAALGPMSAQEKFTQAVFFLMVLLWLTRSPGFFPGWASFFPGHSDYVTDATVALVLGILFFLVPAHGPSRKYESMITWEEFQASMPWKVALLVGGGFALAEGTKESGLSRWVSELLTPLGHLPPLAAVAVACVVVTTVTEVASNAATISIFLPILSPLAEVIRVNPLSVLIPATLCTSFSFLLPASNPPNAVVFAYGHFSAADMVKAGLGANVIGLLAVLLAVGTWGVPLFSLDTYPDWAPPYNATAP